MHPPSTSAPTAPCRSACPCLHAITLTGSSPPDGHLHEPDWHALPPLHRVPHLPQWLLLVRRSVSQSGLVESQLP